MESFLKEIGTGSITGFAVFISIVSFFVTFYRDSIPKDQIKNNKLKLESSVDALAKINLSKLPSYSAKAAVNILEKIFGKPKKYILSDREFINSRTTVFFLGITAIFSLIMTLRWSVSIPTAVMLNFPFLIALSTYMTDILRINQMKYSALRDQKIKKYKNLKKISGLNIFAISYTLTFLSVSVIGIFFYFLDEYNFKRSYLRVLYIFSQYYLYIVLCILSLLISRVLLSEASKQKSIVSFIAVFLFFISTFFISALLSNHLSSSIIKNIKMIIRNRRDILEEIGNLGELTHNLEMQFLGLIAIPIAFPLIILLFVFILGIASRVFLSPIKKLSVLFFELSLKSDAYLYIIFSTISFLTLNYFVLGFIYK